MLRHAAAYAGTYSGSGNNEMTYGGKPLVVTSMAGAAVTIIDGLGTNRGFVFNSGESYTSVLTGLTIQNGKGDYGGAIEIAGASPYVAGCSFLSCQASLSHVNAAYVKLENFEREQQLQLEISFPADAFPHMMRIQHMHALLAWGGHQQHCIGETLRQPGGKLLQADGGCVEMQSIFDGGAVHVTGGTSVFPIFTQCTFRGNLAQSGAGLWLVQAGVNITQSLFEENGAELNTAGRAGAWGGRAFMSSDYQEAACSKPVSAWPADCT